jgi:GTP-binding protein
MEYQEAGTGQFRARHRKSHVVTIAEYEKALREEMPFLEYAPIMFVSALEGYHALQVWKSVETVTQAARQSFSTGQLNRILLRAYERVQPPIREGKRLRIFYVTQKADAPVPTFVLFINQRRLWIDSYGRYLARMLREANAFVGCPILFHLRARNEESPQEKEIPYEPRRTRSSVSPKSSKAYATEGRDRKFRKPGSRRSTR